ncbi:hypothetical protein N7489_003753 [Penicillium chrysogenum]|uniref:Translation machinery-associated protein 22 n=1 Tax=Penicillium chrysogenum TaxID=5076 RepID=A0ABQ8WA21_PENCH|nr:uncharacterized protein N7489_003753 [Penicillium chrysogenum]KAJ5243657.1 hypothetical protein N7489_003753 [Penicillium chrysogenum]KAJ5257428.1 hypothetical protein N7524_008984 [Penicillium chrysogenum]KAJ5260804.1 hypothetical protein N7505_009154 [Penicillium chrysogenum]KAJ6140731.1 hypothetical protein N7497_011624 [Penicillium chrysogenum]
MAEVETAPVVQARHVVYCGGEDPRGANHNSNSFENIALIRIVCTLPPEYCEFGGTAKKCEEWLKENESDLWDKLYSEDALNANLSTLSVSAQERAAKDAAKKEAKAAANEARDSERKAASKILIKRVERNKRKFVTVVIGLEVFGLENKKVAKDLGKKFATGSSVTRSPAGIEEITVQGDVSDDLREWLLEIHGKQIPASNIELIEDKKKKKSEAPMV